MDRKENIRSFKRFIKEINSYNEDENRVKKQLKKKWLILVNLQKEYAIQESLLIDTKPAFEDTIVNLNNVIKAQDIEMTFLKKEKKILSKKIAALGKTINEDKSNISKTDREIAFERRMRLILSKFSTNIFLAETTSLNISGFAFNIHDKAVYPFEIKEMSREKGIPDIWELSKKTSKNSNEWEILFTI